MRRDRSLRVGLLIATMAAGLATTGCATMNNTEKGAVAGGAVGTGVGLLAGAATGNPRTGAAVGGLLGGGLGAIAGSEQDARDERRREVQQASAVAAAQSQQRLGLTDVIHMAQGGHDDQVIINQIRSTGSTYQLSPSDLDFLKNNGVSGRVIAEMQNARAPSPAATRVVVRDPQPVTTVIYEEPACGPPVMVVPYRPYHYRPRPVIYASGVFPIR